MRSYPQSYDSHYIEMHTPNPMPGTPGRPSSIHLLMHSSVVNRKSMQYINPTTNTTTLAIPDSCPSPAPSSIAQLHGLRDVLGNIAENGKIDQDTFRATFQLQEGDDQYFQQYRDNTSQHKLDANAILLQAMNETTLEQDQQLRFIFDLFDTAGLGRIDRQFVGRLLQTSLEQSRIDVVGMDFDNLGELLFQKANATENYITYEQFHNALKQYINGAMPVGSSEATILQAPLSQWQRFYEKHAVRGWWLLLYVMLNVGVFLYKYLMMKNDHAVGISLRIARGSAQMIMLNYALVMLPMCRSIMNSLKRNRLLWRYVPFDDHIEIHKLCGTVLLVAGLVHTIAHVYNIVLLYCVTSEEDYALSGFAQLPGFATLPSFGFSLTRLPIWTGVVLLLITCISFPLAAIPKFRQGNFNLFWYSHMLFGPFLLLSTIHGALSWFATAQSYWWILPPLTIYLTERRFRYGKMFTQPVVIARATFFDDTLGIFMAKPKRFLYRPGMYLYLNCPSISAHEWHPFTISSAPDDQYLSVHIRNAGDWTDALHKLIKEHQEKKLALPFVYVDGPVGAPTQDYHRYKTIVMIGGGIGVTPFASILKDLVNLWNDYRCLECNRVRHPRNFQIQKMYFHWVTRAQDSLRWFENTMNEVAVLDQDNVIETHQYLTSVKREKNAPLKLFQTFVHGETGKDFISGLCTKTLTHFGRPNWDHVFQNLVASHPGECIGVFFCGPHVLERILDDMCRKYSTNSDRDGTYFEFHSEKFA